MRKRKQWWVEVAAIAVIGWLLWKAGTGTATSWVTGLGIPQISLPEWAGWLTNWSALWNAAWYLVPALLCFAASSKLVQLDKFNLKITLSDWAAAAGTILFSMLAVMTAGTTRSLAAAVATVGATSLATLTVTSRWAANNGLQIGVQGLRSTRLTGRAGTVRRWAGWLILSALIGWHLPAVVATALYWTIPVRSLAREQTQDRNFAASLISAVAAGLGVTGNVLAYENLSISPDRIVIAQPTEAVLGKLANSGLLEARLQQHLPEWQLVQADRDAIALVPVTAEEQARRKVAEESGGLLAGMPAPVDGVQTAGAPWPPTERPSRDVIDDWAM